MTEISKAYRAAFEYHKRWQPCPASLEEWDAATQEICFISNQGGNDPFLKDLLVAVFNDLERKYTERTEEAKCG